MSAATPGPAMSPFDDRHGAGLPQQVLGAILQVTTAQWAQALRAEGAAGRAAVIETLGARIASTGRYRSAAPLVRREARRGRLRP